MGESCDVKDCGNKAYREVDYFTNRKVRQRAARIITSKHLSETGKRKYVREMFRTRMTAWNNLCRKDFEEERDAGRIFMWSRVHE